MQRESAKEETVALLLWMDRRRTNRATESARNRLSTGHNGNRLKTRANSNSSGVNLTPEIDVKLKSYTLERRNKASQSPDL